MKTIVSNCRNIFCNGTVNSNLLIQIFAVKPTHFLNLMKKSQNVAIRMQSSTTLSYVILKKKYLTYSNK
jgi:hypothetical protein